MLRKGSEKLLVQCKQWRATTVGVEIVRELYGLIAAEGATGGFVVTAGRFSLDATTFAAGRNIQLINGTILHGWLKQAQTQQTPARHLRRVLRGGAAWVYRREGKRVYRWARVILAAGGFGRWVCLVLRGHAPDSCPV